MSRKKTLVLDVGNLFAANKEIELAARILSGGGLVAFPTETVYGLGANGLDAGAVAKIFAAKGRPQDNPLILHMAQAEEMRRLAINIPPRAFLLAGEFWPGPLTLILEKNHCVPPEATGGLGSVALRVPDHPVALALLRACKLPLAAPSANLSGRPSPTLAEHVLEDLDGRIDAVLDGGPAAVGLESTVLDVRGGRARILRPGAVTAEQIEAVLREEVVMAWDDQPAGAPLSPGMKYAHYQPRAPMILVTGSETAVTRKLSRLLESYLGQGMAVGLLVSAETAAVLRGGVVDILGSGDDKVRLAANFYASLRRLDACGVDIILAQGFSREGIGSALMNRMSKAAAGQVLKAE